MQNFYENINEQWINFDKYIKGIFAVLSQIFSKTKSMVILDEFMPRDHRIVQK
jgi:hypothetical protein